MSDRRAPSRMTIAITCAVVGLVTIALDAEDWPQWRGVERDAIWRDTGLVERFADDGLIVKWRAPVRGGFAGPAVAGGRVFVLDYQETPGSRTMDGPRAARSFLMRKAARCSGRRNGQRRTATSISSSRPVPGQRPR